MFVLVCVNVFVTERESVCMRLSLSLRESVFERVSECLSVCV